METVSCITFWTRLLPPVCMVPTPLWAVGPGGERPPGLRSWAPGKETEELFPPRLPGAPQSDALATSTRRPWRPDRGERILNLEQSRLRDGEPGSEPV